ncbi:hypothetical protein ACSS31_28455 (plasmid) [Priestia megaterium]
MKHLVINGVDFQVANFEEQVVKNEETSEDLKEISFTFSVIGESQNNLYQAFFEASKYEVFVPDSNETFNAKKGTLSFGYTGNGISQDTEVNFSVKLNQVSEIEPKSSMSDMERILMNLSEESLLARARFKTLLDLLIEKDVLSAEDYEEKFDKDLKENIDKFHKQLFEGMLD